jgi:hypothetical protein
MDGYTTVKGFDQNGQTINQYTNNQSKCKSECDSNINCAGIVTNGSNCRTIKSFSSPYSKSGSTTYKKIIYPIPAVTSSNFPTSPNNNLFSSIFCKNISTNNGLIQKANSIFNNLPIYKTQSVTNENTCLNNCNTDKYCSSYNFIKNASSSNCLLYNKVPSSITTNNNNNIGYKNNYKYDFNNLNTSQKNVVRNDCINNYLNNTYSTNNLNYTSCYTLGNNNSEINFNASCLANMYTPLNKIKVVNNYTNINSNIINPITNKELNDFSNNYDEYLQTQIGLLNSSNKKNNNNNNNLYIEEINYKTNIEADNAKNALLEKKIINTEKIIDNLNGIENITENFENNMDYSNNITKSNIINFYLFIFIVLVFLYIIYYLKKNK